MRRRAELEAASARRTELLGRDLAAAGRVLPAPEDPPPGAVVLPLPGRHTRPRRSTPGLPAWIGERPAWLPDYGPAHLAVITTAVAAAMAVTAWIVIGSAPRSVPVPAAHTAPAAVPTTLPTALSTTSGAPAPGGTPTGVVVVDIAGRVRHPGIARLPAGSRVIDALQYAGGALHRSDLTALNLARPLTDGEQILVGKAPPPVAGASTAPAGTSAPAGPVSLNSATLEQLDTLPGVGPVTAQKIVDWRTQHGRFTAVNELLEVDGIGEKTLADIAPLVTL